MAEIAAFIAIKIFAPIALFAAFLFLCFGKKLPPPANWGNRDRSHMQ